MIHYHKRTLWLDCSGKRFCKLGITRFFYYIGFVFNSGGLSIYINQDSAIQKICDAEINDPDNYPAGTSVALNFSII